MKPKQILRCLEPKEVSKNRHHDCLNYSICLTIAAKADWRSFTCKVCTMFPETSKIYVSELNQNKEE
jgi:hypothetical protein